MKTKEEILKWLRQHDWYFSFEINTVNFRSKTLDEYLSDIIINDLQKSVIRNAFCWLDSKEGVLYWSEVDKEYLKWLIFDNTNKTMKQTIEIEVPEGKKAVWKNGYIVFEDTELPKTWEEFCEGHFVDLNGEFYIDDESSVKSNKDGYYIRAENYDKNLLPSKESAEAHLALMQLHQLRDCYRQGWIPSWNNFKTDRYCIEFMDNHYTIDHYTIFKYNTSNKFLSFQSREIAEEFLTNFRDLIEKAGDLI